MASIPQSHNIDNYFGPFDSINDAVKAVVDNCGECRGVLWRKNGEYWSTEQRWNLLPDGAFMADMVDDF